MLNVVEIVIPIFFVMAVGFILFRKGMLDKSFVETSNKVVYNICLPALLFVKIAQSDFSKVFNLSIVLLMLSIVIIIFLLAYPISKVFHIPEKMKSTFIVGGFRGNYAYMGLPVCFYAYGQDGVVIASLLIAFVTPLVNVCSVAALVIFGGCEGRSIKQVLVETFLNPLTLACLAGLIIALCRIPLPFFFTRSIEIVGDLALPLALFCIGTSIRLDSLKGAGVPVMVGVGIKLVLMPLLTFWGMKMLGMEIGVMGKVLILLMGSPTAAATYVLAATLGGDKETASAMIVATTIGSIISYAFWLQLLGV